MCIFLHYQHHSYETEGEGIHPWDDLQRVVYRKLGDHIPIQQLQRILAENSNRAVISARGVGANCGHTLGQAPNYDRYTGFQTLYHMTSARNQERIKETGLNRQRRQYIHLTNDRSKSKKGRDRIIQVKPEDLRQNQLKIYKTKQLK